MKNLIIASVIAGAAVAGLLFYLRSQMVEYDEVDEIEDAADDAYTTMNRNIGKVERSFDHALN